MACFRRFREKNPKRLSFCFERNVFEHRQKFSQRNSFSQIQPFFLSFLSLGEKKSVSTEKDFFSKFFVASSNPNFGSGFGFGFSFGFGFGAPPKNRFPRFRFRLIRSGFFATVVASSAEKNSFSSIE